MTIGAALVLSACGGGSGGAGGVSSTPAPTTPITSLPNSLTPISAANSGSAASNAYAASASISDASSAVSAALTGVSIDGQSVSIISPALDIVTRAYKKNAPKLLTGVAISDSCSGGGTVSTTGTVQSEDVASNGDTLTFTSNNCVENGATINGAFTIVLSGIVGTAFADGAWGATLGTQLAGFSVASGSTTVAVSGDMKIAISHASLNSGTLAISGKSLQASQSTAGVKVATRTLADYSATAVIQGNTLTATANYALSGGTASLGLIAYSVKNTKPFVSANGGTPTSGSLIVNGASSSVTVTVLDAAYVRLDYSAKGDGVITQSTTVSWPSFKANF